MTVLQIRSGPSLCRLYASSRPFTADQLQWRQFFQEFTWLDLARGGTYLHPDAIRPRTLEDALVDDFYSVLCGSALPQSSWARTTRRSYQGWVTAYCDFCQRIRGGRFPVRRSLSCSGSTYS